MDSRITRVQPVPRIGFSILLAAALATFPVAAALVAPHDPFETIDYSGRLTVLGKPFNGQGSFKFVLLQKDGTRLWSNGDNEPPIEEGVPSGAVTLPVRDGIYRVRL